MSGQTREQEAKRLIECTGDGYAMREIVGVYDVATMEPEELEKQRQRHNREFVYAGDYDRLLSALKAAQEERDKLKADNDIMRTADYSFVGTAAEQARLQQRAQAAESALAELRAKVEEHARQSAAPLDDWERGYKAAIDVVVSILPENGEQP